MVLIALLIATFFLAVPMSSAAVARTPEVLGPPPAVRVSNINFYGRSATICRVTRGGKLYLYQNPFPVLTNSSHGSLRFPSVMAGTRYVQGAHYLYRVNRGEEYLCAWQYFRVRGRLNRFGTIPALFVNGPQVPFNRVVNNGFNQATGGNQWEYGSTSAWAVR